MLKDMILSFAEEIKQTEAEKARALEDAQKNADVASALEIEKNAANQALEAANKELEQTRTAIANLSANNLRLQDQIKQATAIGITRKPTITKTVMKDVAGIAIPKGNAPSASQDQNARDMMLLASMMGFNAWRGFFNLQEVKAHTAMVETNVNHLPGYGRRLGLTFVADTLNWAAVNLNDSDLKIYLEGLRKMAGKDPFVGYFDDANQYRDETKYPRGTLERLVGRIRAIAPDIILIASLTANAIINDYEPLFDFTEAQTFGKIGELPTFLGRDFDVYCLDGRKETSLDYLMQSVEIVGRFNPKNVFYYVTAITDWKGMPEKLPLIKQAVQRWMALTR